jgi:EAL domain-containing protein (putative c-di-GMP-specific phosphodiesterase class I)
VEHELTLAYQPLHELSRRSIVGVEALSRWEHPDLGPIAPPAFIRLAEQSGLIVPLGRLVLHAACRQMRAWLDAGAPPGMDLFVNVSAIQFAHRDFATELGEILKATRLPPKNLVVEVTESALVDAPDAVASFAAIKALGVRIAIDDFGTGYSSISYLARFPVDILKIDRSFVSALNASHTSESLVRVILALGASLSLDTVAEGIETEQQLELLTRMGCTLGQGYLLSRPTSPDEIEHLLGLDVPGRTWPAAVDLPAA